MPPVASSIGRDRAPLTAKTNKMQTSAVSKTSTASPLVSTPKTSIVTTTSSVRRSLVGVPPSAPPPPSALVVSRAKPPLDEAAAAEKAERKRQRKERKRAKADRTDDHDNGERKKRRSEEAKIGDAQSAIGDGDEMRKVGILRIRLREPEPPIAVVNNGAEPITAEKLAMQADQQAASVGKLRLKLGKAGVGGHVVVAAVSSAAPPVNTADRAPNAAEIAADERSKSRSSSRAGKKRHKHKKHKHQRSRSRSPHRPSSSRASDDRPPPRLAPQQPSPSQPPLPRLKIKIGGDKNVALGESAASRANKAARSSNAQQTPPRLFSSLPTATTTTTNATATAMTTATATTTTATTTTTTTSARAAFISPAPILTSCSSSAFLPRPDSPQFSDDEDGECERRELDKNFHRSFSDDADNERLRNKTSQLLTKLR